MYNCHCCALHVRIAAALAALFVVAIAPPTQTDALAQNRIEGTVTDSETGTPLPGVHIYLETARSGVISATDGSFELLTPAANDVLVARFVGYDTWRKNISANAAQRVDIALVPADVELGDVVVSATRERQFESDIAASIGSISGKSIREQNPSHPADILGQVSGVWVNNTSGEGHMTAIRQPLSTDPLYLFLENGVATRSTGFFNHNALYEINIPQSDGIEVMKGPGTALYGSDAIGGVINVTSGAAPASPMVDVTAEGGSFGYKRALFSTGTTVGLNGLRLDVNVTDSDGWRDNTEFKRQSATLRWDRRSRSNWIVRTVASWSNIDQEPAGSASLSEEEFRRDAKQNFQPISFREVSALRVSSAFEKFYAKTLVSITPYARFNSMDLLPNWSLTFDPAVWETQNYSVGANLKVRRDVASLRGRIVSGVDLDLSPGERVERRVDPTRTGPAFTSFTVEEKLYDYDVTYRQASPYVHLETSPTERLRVTAGLRLDLMGYDYNNNLSVVTEGRHRRPGDTTVSYSHLSPKFGLTYQVHPLMNVFGSYRHAFRAPSESQVFRQGSSINTVELDPVKVDNFDAGVRGRIPGVLSYDFTGYYLVKRDDILRLVLPDGTQASSNAGETKHRGIEAGVTTHDYEGLSLRFSGSYAEHTFEDWKTQNGTDFSGNEMDIAPRVLVNASATYRAPVLSGASVTLEWSRLGSYWMDPENTAKYGGHDLLNLNVNVGITDEVTLLTRVSNLTDELFAERATHNRFRGDEFAPGLPRRVHVSLRYSFR